MKIFRNFLLGLVLTLILASINHEVTLAITTLGLFGTGKFETNEAPEDWRETILYLFPNGDAPLTAVLSKMKNEKTTSKKFHWWEKGLVQKVTTSTQIDLAAVTTITLADTSHLRKDLAMVNLTTQEIVICTADPASATTVAVARGASNTTAVDTANGQEWMVIGTSFAEGSTSGSSIYSGPGEQYNYCQIFKTPLEITESANIEEIRTGNKYQDMKAEALRSHSIDLEMGFLFGNRHADTGSNGQPRRFTGGIDRHFITSNRFDAGGTLTKVLWNNYMEQLSQKGSGERMVLCGSRWNRVIHEMVEADTQYQISTGESVYGVRMTRLVTPFGMDLLLNIHPLFNTSATLQKQAICLDLNNITERTFRATQFKTDVQDNDADMKKDVFLTETGLEVQHEETHAVFEDFNAFA